MAKIVFDQPREAVETPAKPPPQPAVDLRWGAKHAPGPEIRGCDECDARTMPQWHEGRDVFCERCVPASLRNAGREPS